MCVCSCISEQAESFRCTECISVLNWAERWNVHCTWPVALCAFGLPLFNLKEGFFFGFIFLPPLTGFRTCCLCWEEESHQRMNHLSLVRQESRLAGKHAGRVFGAVQMNRGRRCVGGGGGFGSDGWEKKKPGIWAEVLLLQRKRLPRRETRVRVFCRLQQSMKIGANALMQPLLQHKHHSFG